MSDDADSIKTLAGAFSEVSDTMRAVHSVFMKLAIGIPIVLILFMGMMTMIIVRVNSNTSARIGNQVDKMPQEIIKALNVSQNQTTIVNPADGRDQQVRDVLEGKFIRTPRTVE